MDEFRMGILTNAVSAEEVDSVSQLIDRTSSWNHLKRVMGWVLRFKNRLLSLLKKRKEVKELLSHSRRDEREQKDVLKNELQSVKDLFLSLWRK